MLGASDCANGVQPWHNDCWKRALCAAGDVGRTWRESSVCGGVVGGADFAAALALVVARGGGRVGARVGAGVVAQTALAAGRGSCENFSELAFLGTILRSGGWVWRK
jgi:hypothetical protein